jgi:hypothetical protein
MAWDKKALILFYTLSFEAMTDTPSALPYH